jgi:hypothetical protein
MNQEKLHALLAIIVPQILQYIMEQQNTDVKEAATILYNSKLYEMLENEESKLWHLSAATLCALLKQELSTGSIDFPEEQ